MAGAEAMADDPEFAAAVQMTFRHIRTPKRRDAISFDAFVAWWRRKDEEDEDGAGLSEEMLAEAQAAYSQHERSAQGIDAVGLAEVLVALELEGYMELEEPEEPDDDHDSDEDVLLDGLDDLEMSDGEDGQQAGAAPASSAGSTSAGTGPAADAEGEADVADHPEGDFHAELQSMKLSELRQKAKELRADREDVADALDDDDPKSAMVALLMERKEEMDEDRAELEGMKMSELREMAVDLELEDDKLEAALDDDDPKEALINALLAMAESDEEADDGLLDGLDDLQVSGSDEEGAKAPKDQPLVTVPQYRGAGPPVPVPVPKPPTQVTPDESGSGGPETGETMLELDHEELKAVFASIDTDGNGFIDPDEFTTLCHELDSSMTDDDMEDAFDTMDQDADGEISFED
eukprot:COSAG02_NODE_12015_length_1613_cov_1.401585_1_plen_405_part_10